MAFGAQNKELSENNYGNSISTSHDFIAKIITGLNFKLMIILRVPAPLILSMNLLVLRMLITIELLVESQI